MATAMADMATTDPMATGAGERRRGLLLLWQSLRPTPTMAMVVTVAMVDTADTVMAVDMAMAGERRRGPQLLWLSQSPRLMLKLMATDMSDMATVDTAMDAATGEGRRGMLLLSPAQSQCLLLRLMPTLGMATTDTEGTEGMEDMEDMGTDAVMEATTGVRKESYC